MFMRLGYANRNVWHDTGLGALILSKPWSEVVPMLTQEDLKSKLHYEPETGIFTRIACKGHPQRIGYPAGHNIDFWYTKISVDGKNYLAHRLAFLYMTGGVPKYVDHINRRKGDNRWDNLRPATRSQNAVNTKTPNSNTSGYRGVTWHARDKKWIAKFGVNGKRINIGYFDCKHHAFCEYVLASRKYNGDFSPV